MPENDRNKTRETADNYENINDDQGEIIPKIFHKKAANIKIICLDVDGVLTDGRIILGSGGQEYKTFDAKDGQAIKIAQQQGLEFALITGRRSQAVEIRADELDISKVYQNVSSKIDIIEKLLKKYNYSLANVLYTGDDISDLQAIKKSGLGCTVKDGAKEAQKSADYIAGANGGRGAVREIIELLLKARESWL